MKRISRTKARELGFKNATEANDFIKGVHGYNKVKSIKRFNRGFTINDDNFIWSSNVEKRLKQQKYAELKDDKDALNSWLKSISSDEEVFSTEENGNFDQSDLWAMIEEDFDVYEAF